MERLIVLERPERWPFEIPGVEIVPAREYLTAPRWADMPRATVLNFCRSYARNSTGYYVSLLALARGHRAIPSVTTVQSMRLDSVVRVVSDELHDTMQSSLRPLAGPRFELAVYFGRAVEEPYARLASQLFYHAPIPFLRARFERDSDGTWELGGIRALAASEVADEDQPFVIEAAERYFRRSPGSGARRKEMRYDLAILWSEADPQPPSDAGAIRKFIRAAERAGIKAEVIGPEDFGRLEVYDALFIRETTQVGHHTHRFALRAQAAGLVVIDDPESIVRCTNKVYQAELFGRRGIPMAKTLVVHEGNRDAVADAVGFPCVLKDPTGSFSLGTLKAESQPELTAALGRLLGDSELVIAQEWTPTPFDWRIGVLAGRALFASRYHMARGHWQVARPRAGSGVTYGRVEAVDLADVPERVLEVALAAAALIGPGLYGVDLKALDDGRVIVTEVNDNPNIDAGCEDGVVGDALYDTIMEHFSTALEARGRP